MMEGFVREGDTCPDCGEGIVDYRDNPSEGWLECDNCGARWNDRGIRVASGEL